MMLRALSRIGVVEAEEGLAAAGAAITADGLRLHVPLFPHAALPLPPGILLNSTATTAGGRRGRR